MMINPLSYRALIILLFTSCILLILLSLCFLHGKVRGKRKKIVRIEQSILQLAASLINVAPKSFASSIERGIQELMHEFELDRFKLFEFRENYRRIVLTANRVVPGTPLGMSDIDITSFPNAGEVFKGGAPFIASRLDEIDPRFRELKEMAASQGIQSLAVFPLYSGEDLTGILVFASLRSRIRWTREIIHSLSMAASVVGLALVHVRTEANRQETEARFKAIHDAAPIGIEQISMDGRFMKANPAFCEMIGYPENELLAMTHEQLTSADDREAESRLIKQILQGGENFYSLDKRYIHKNGSILWAAINAALVRDENGDPAYWISVSQDIGARKSAEDALRDSESRIRLALQVGRIYSFEYDVSSDMINRSLNSVDILGLPKRQSWDTGTSFLERIHPEDRNLFTNLRQGLNPENRNYQITYRSIRPRGGVVWIEENGRGEFDASGQLKRVAGIAADVTSRREEDLARWELSRKLIQWQEQDRGRIARELHDDIGQRLALLAVTLDRMQLQIPDRSSAVKLQLLDAWKYLHEVTSDLQKVSHELHAGKLQHLGLAVALRNLCNEFARQNNVNIAFSGPSSALVLDERIQLALYRISQEALRNVAKHSHAKKVNLSLLQEQEDVKLVISDDGVGFDPEPTAHQPGLGLLSMKERLLVLGGTLSVRSAPGNGTILDVRIPVLGAGIHAYSDINS